MIIAGNCLYINEKYKKDVIKTAKKLKGVADMFRVKLFGGGTTPEKYAYGVGFKGAQTLKEIQKFIPVSTEVHTPLQSKCLDWMDSVWIGARNSHNYTLLKEVAKFPNDVYIKRGAGMTIDEVIGVYDIMNKIYNKKIYIIERGINTFDRLEYSRWSPDLKGVIRLKYQRPDIFKRLIVDCSHSVFVKYWIEDTYKAFKSIGVEHFMFECSYDGESPTDSQLMLSVKELKRILRGLK
jgi:3-deoxy-7-phosphoheptulonate synthase